MTTAERNTHELAAEHLADALDADELDEKDFHVREALQLLDLEDD